jgi:AhpD family alkylhydroperoxidase
MDTPAKDAPVMKARLNYPRTSPDGYKAMLALQAYINDSGLEHSLLELVKIRASQINGCAFCLALHAHDARKAGESEARIHLLDAWRDAPLYSARERAALALTEAMTKISEVHVPDDVYDEVRANFSEKETVDLAWSIAAINAWNRMAITFRVVPLAAHTGKAAG